MTDIQKVLELIEEQDDGPLYFDKDAQRILLDKFQGISDSYYKKLLGPILASKFSEEVNAMMVAYLNCDDETARHGEVKGVVDNGS